MIEERQRRVRLLPPGLVASSLLAIAGVLPARAQKPLPMPPGAGVSVVQTLSTPEGDRESVHTVAEATARGLRWIWQVTEVGETGDTVRQQFRYTELRGDLADAIRFRAYHDVNAPEEHPGYTMHALSRAVYRRLRAVGSDTFQIMAVESRGGGMLASFGMGRGPAPVRWRGTVSVVTPAPVAFPLLVNGRRVEVPALHLRGRLAVRSNIWEPELWILADSAYPLLLKWIGAPAHATNLLQTIRVDVPVDLPALARGMSASCRAELPGIYFGFNSAVLGAASDRTIAAVADLLVNHSDWIVTLEGHTDSIGSAAANRLLSERRVESVRARLMGSHRVDGARLKTAGFGSARPRESNTTVEGRARNRRVELVRECARQ